MIQVHENQSVFIFTIEMSDVITQLAETLEHQKKQIAALEKELRDGKAQIKTLREFHSVMEDVQGINAMSQRKLQASGAADVPQMTDGIAGLIMRIHELENTHTYWRNAKSSLESSVHTLEEQAQLKRDQLYDVQRQVLAIKGHTCWNMRKLHKENSFESENHTEELKKELDKVSQENATLEKCNQEQTSLIEELTAEASANARLPDDYASACDLLESKTAELTELEEDIAREIRLSAQKKRITTQKMAIRDPVTQYDAKKRGLQNELKKVAESRRREEKNVLAHANAISQDIEKGKAVVQILKSHLTKERQIIADKGEGEFFTKQTDLLKMIQEVSANASHLREVDRKIEKAVDDISVVQKARVTAAKSHAQASKSRLDEILVLESDIQARETAFKNQKKQLQRDNEILEQEFFRKFQLKP